MPLRWGKMFHMKVIETILDNVSGETREVSWGNNITSDLSIVTSVAQIIAHQRDREAGEVHVWQGRLTTVAIRIEL